MSLSAVTHSSRDSTLNEQMHSFIKKANKNKEFVDKLTSAFKKLPFFEVFIEIAPKLLLLTPKLEMCHFVIELTIKAIEISPVLARKVSADLAMDFVDQFDQLTKPEDSATSQLIYENLCRLFELVAANDAQMTVFKELLCQSVAKIFEGSFESINFVLVFGKILTFLNKLGVK